jgi:hypothetical protein
MMHDFSVINFFSNVVGYKINIQNPVVYVLLFYHKNDILNTGYFRRKNFKMSGPMPLVSGEDHG